MAAPTAVFAGLQAKEFDLHFTYHADAILSRDFPAAAQDLEETIAIVAIPIGEIAKGGGGEAQVTQRLRRALVDRGWRKRIFRVEKKINDRTTFSQSHEVDHIKDFGKGTLALEIEWNNKDPFFDRDLENFNRLHADGAISAGVIVTRGSTFQDGIEERIRSFARARGIGSYADLENLGLNPPTPRQRRDVERFVGERGGSFADGWSVFFTRDKFSSATTHWAKLKSRLDRGVGSPCPLVAVGIPLSCVVE